MTAGKYLLVLVFILLSGLLGGAFMGLFGGAIASQLAQFGIVPKPFREHAVAWKGFEVVDTRGKQRVLLDKYGLQFFDEKGQQFATLSSGMLSLGGRQSNITVTSGGSHAISFSRITGPHSHVEFLSQPELRLLPDEIPKLGVYRQDGRVVWEVPGAVKCPTLAPEAINLGTLLPLVGRLSPTEKLQLIEQLARELSAINAVRDR